MKDGWYWFDSGYACGAIVVKNGEIIKTAPIFRKMIGWKAGVMHYRGKYVWIGED